MLGSCDRNAYASTVRREAQSIFDQISDGAVEQDRIGKYFSIATARDINMSIFGGCLIEDGDFFERRARIKQ